MTSYIDRVWFKNLYSTSSKLLFISIISSPQQKLLVYGRQLSTIYLFGITSLRLTVERIKNCLFMNAPLISYGPICRSTFIYNVHGYTIEHRPMTCLAFSKWDPHVYLCINRNARFKNNQL